VRRGWAQGGAEIESDQAVWVDPQVESAVLEALCRASEIYKGLRSALTDPGSQMGARLYGELKKVAVGDESLQNVLHSYL
jgi:hypothetical protein